MVKLPGASLHAANQQQQQKNVIDTCKKNSSNKVLFDQSSLLSLHFNSQIGPHYNLNGPNHNKLMHCTVFILNVYDPKL